jgi:phosphoribosylaminoimidazolecarboxamide formyltransferase/IMP cyclohydrolase
MSRPRALLSVSDKSGIEDLGAGLVERGWEILSTGGTARRLREAGLPVTDVAEATGHPEMMDGRVKTLHPAIHAGLLARRDRDDDMAALDEHGYAPIDLVAVNLYPFRQTVASGDVSLRAAMEKVDIGGPTMIRAAAKNHRDVWVVVDPSDYPAVLEALDGDGGEREAALRFALAARVFEHISGYDAAVATYLSERAAGHLTDADPALPLGLDLGLSRDRTLRYGENPDQAAAFYVGAGDRAGVAGLEQHHGKELSYNNLLDLDGALLAVAPFAFSPRPAVAIIKHTTPCGLAVGDTLEAAYRQALATDPVSAFGSVIATTRSVDAATAEAMSSLFIEGVAAPAFDEAAFEILTRKKNLRLLTFPETSAPGPVDPGAAAWEGLGEGPASTAAFLAGHGASPAPRSLRSVYGGVLAQTPPTPPFYGVDAGEWRVVTERSPTDAEWDDLRFAWAAVFSVKSNAILLARDTATLGIGAGQMSRVDSSRIAVQKAADAGLDLDGAALASDAFFPFRDGVDAAAKAGVRAIVQPGGSVRDQEVTDAADEHGITMVFTGRRLFRH